MGCSSCQQNNHVVPTTHVHNSTTQLHCECACGCDEPVCPTPQPCTEITDSKCIIYTGVPLTCEGDTVVTTNASVATALDQIVTYFCENGGQAGPVGPAGANGTNGTNGATGATGAQGIQGPIGLTGAAGANGTNGIDGVDGAQGIQGLTGATGSVGATGATGPQGSIGLTGATGAQGTQGIQGIQGIEGPIGPAGGVTSIIAGTNITISPVGGTGTVTINSSGGGGGGSQFTHEIGEYVPTEGGVIIHRWLSINPYGVPDAGSVQNYIVMDSTDLSLSATWGLSGIFVPTCDSLWNGESNTNQMIVTGAAIGTAAVLCNNSNNGSKTDWYLPSIDELRFMVQNRFLININQFNFVFSPLAFTNYFSSTQITDTQVWIVSNINGIPNATTKNSPIGVRAVRKFSI